MERAGRAGSTRPRCSTDSSARPPPWASISSTARYDTHPRPTRPPGSHRYSVFLLGWALEGGRNRVGGRWAQAAGVGRARHNRGRRRAQAVLLAPGQRHGTTGTPLLFSFLTSFHGSHHHYITITTTINPGGQVVADAGSHASCGAEETVLAAAPLCRSIAVSCLTDWRHAWQVRVRAAVSRRGGQPGQDAAHHRPVGRLLATRGLRVRHLFFSPSRLHWFV